MGNAGSAPEQVYKAAKLNNQEQLNNLIREARRQNNNRLPHGFLEYTDDEGRTPLCVACSKNNNHVVETLLRSGANVHHMSRSSNSGSPLHAAVFHRSYYSIEPLLRHGASPFVMNVMGRTPYDMVQEYKLLDLLRLFEHYSLYAGWMMVECSRLGLTGYKPEWVLRWCVLIQRLPCPVNQQQQRVVRTQLCIYENQRAVEPLHFKPIWIDGSHIEVPQSTGGQHVLCLHPSHQRVRGRIYVRTAKTGVQKLGFKACDSTQSSIAYVQRFESKVNELFQRSRNQANVPQPPPPQTPTGGDPQRYPNIQADAAPQPGGPGGAPPASGPGTPAPIATPPAPIATPPPGAALPGETDEMMARRLQEEYNRELGIPPSAANRPGTASSYPQPAPDPVKPPRAPSAPMLSSEPGTSASSDAPPPPPLPHPAVSLPVHAEEKPPEPSASAGKATTWNSEEMFICSITQEVMEDPVLADDGHSYERAAIESWFSTGRTTSPLTGRPMDKHLTPNHTLRNIIQAWKEQQQPQQ